MKHGGHNDDYSVYAIFGSIKTVFMQALWRGHSLRRRIKNKKVHEVRSKVQEATRNVKEENKLYHRTSIALEFLLSYRDVSHMLQTLNQLGQ